MKNIIATIAIIIILALVILYIAKQKKKGVKCIGCPSGKACASKKSLCSGSCCNCQKS